MSGNVHWILEVSINDGELDNFKALMEEMVAATQADEPGALNYEWFLSPDGKTCHIYERYADSDATRVHMKNFGEKFAGRFMGCVKMGRTDLYGDPDDQLKGMLAGMGAVHYSQIGGFAR
jgi:quinol monooxygenase YgiN